MNDKIKNIFKKDWLELVIVFIAIFLAAYLVFGSWNISSDREGTSNIRTELRDAQTENGRIQENIQGATDSVAKSLEGARRGEEISEEAGGVIRESQSILRNIRERNESTP